MKLSYIGIALFLTTAAWISAQTPVGNSPIEDSQKALAESKNDSEKISAMLKVSKAYFDAADFEQAKRYCDMAVHELARASSKEEHAQQTLVAITSVTTHQVNTILGRIALAQGDIDEAKSRLLASGAVRGSATLSSFGPSMALAKELLVRGESKAVLEYFALCGKFWRRKDDLLREWTEQVQKGEMPLFPKYLL